MILNGDQVYCDELIRENARLTIQHEADRLTLEQMRKQCVSSEECTAKVAEAYAAAALKFVNGKGAKAVIFDEDGIRRMYSEAENIFASVYPDGTISTFFHPRAGKKYWESQVKKYAKK